MADDPTIMFGSFADDGSRGPHAHFAILTACTHGVVAVILPRFFLIKMLTTPFLLSLINRRVKVGRDSLVSTAPRRHNCVLTPTLITYKHIESVLDEDPIFHITLTAN
jgi:hypothetical protein